MNIFVTGQGTLHWGRLEFGNLGNYYVMDPIFGELRRNFPDAIIKTTFQFSDGFCEKHGVEMIPMETYWDFNSEDNLKIAKEELECVKRMKKGEDVQNKTIFVETVVWSDVFIDVSGDIWGDNANFLGKDRFEVGLIKDMIAQELGKPTFMIAGSPGPFNDERTKEIAKSVYSNFTCVTNREPLSTELLKQWGFDCRNTKDLACPSFLFQPESARVGEDILKKEGLREDERPVIGLIICGWDFVEGPFDKWPRRDDEYENFVELVEYITNNYDAKVCVMSHSNGFKVPPAEFELIHGRDYPIAKQLEQIAKKRGLEIYSINGLYSAEETKAFMGRFEMLISGRLHGAVAGLSQEVPTVTIDYGHEPKAHKLRGFNIVIGQEKFVADPSSKQDLIEKVSECWNNRDDVRKDLNKRLPLVKQLARDNFEIVKRYFDNK